MLGKSLDDSIFRFMEVISVSWGFFLINGLYMLHRKIKSGEVVWGERGMKRSVLMPLTAY